MTYKLEGVMRVTRDALFYLDDEGAERRVDLRECAKNWVEYVNGGNAFSERKGMLAVEHNTCVGWRDWYAERPYFEFFAKPTIRFELFHEKKFAGCFHRLCRGRNHKRFSKITQLLNDAGWTTYDLS